MKALSIRQPWIWAILNAGKRIENRSKWRGCSYRGPVLLHAAKGCGRGEFDDGIESILSIVRPTPGEERLKFKATLAEMHVALRGVHHGEGTWRPAPALPFGGIVGRAQIVVVILPGGVYSSRAAPKDPAESAESPWYIGGLALVLADVEPLPFVPWKGSLGLFEVDEGALERAGIEAQRS